MATVSRRGSLTIRLSAAERQVLHRVQYELDNSGVSSEFAADPAEPGEKSAGDLASILVVVVATLAEARRIIKILVDARAQRAQTIRASVDDDGRVIEVTNADPSQIEKIIEGHFGADRELPGDQRSSG